MKRDAFEGVDDFGTAAVVEREGERGAGVGGCGLGRALHYLLHVFRQFVDAADEGQADVVAQHGFYFGGEVGLEEAHEEADFGAGAAQIVFEGKGVEGEIGKADAGGGFGDSADGFSAALMAEEALEAALVGPAAIAVHDDGDVARHAIGVQPAVDCQFFGRKLFHTAEWSWRRQLISPFNFERSTRVLRDAKTGRTQKRPLDGQPSLLRGAATAGGDFADLVEEQRALQRIDLEQQWRDLCDKGIREHVVRDVAAVCEELGQVHLERICKPL